MIEQMLDWLARYWQAAALVVTWAGIVLVWLKHRSDWAAKRFSGQVNFSLNYVDDGVLRLRTLLEESADRVWLNEHGVKLVRRAAEQTSKAQPFLRLRSRADMEYVKRAVVNVLSERFSDAFVGRAMGAPVATSRFVFGVTWERYGGIRTQKLRVIVVREDDLEAIATADPAPKVAARPHVDRLTTLRVMWSLLASNKPRARSLIGTIELGVVVPHGEGSRPETVAPEAQAESLAAAAMDATDSAEPIGLVGADDADDTDDTDDDGSDELVYRRA